MADILERLRRGEHWPQTAADEITRLRAQNAGLVAALREVECDCYEVCESEFDKMEWCPCYIARAALASIETPKPSAEQNSDD